MTGEIIKLPTAGRKAMWESAGWTPDGEQPRHKTGFKRSYKGKRKKHRSKLG